MLCLLLIHFNLNSLTIFGSIDNLHVYRSHHCNALFNLVYVCTFKVSWRPEVRTLTVHTPLTTTKY